MRLRLLACAALAVFLCGCAPRVRPVAAPPTLSGDAAHPARAQGWIEAKLYFGLGPADHPEKGIGEARWRLFLDREVTPRFPSGLTVLDAYGQWQATQQPAPERLHSKLLVIYMPDSEENRAKLDALRSAWKKLTGDQSVLLATQPADVSF